MGRYENKYIQIFITFNKIIINKRKIAEKSRGNTYKITHISVDVCPRVTNLISKKCLDKVLFPYGQIGKQIYSNIHINI